MKGTIFVIMLATASSFTLNEQSPTQNDQQALENQLLAARKQVIDIQTGESQLMDCHNEREQQGIDKLICTIVRSPKQMLSSEQVGEEELTTGETITYASVAFLLVMFGGLMSGLTVGLASIDRLSLEIESKRNEDVKKASVKIFRVLDQFHWMLVTLLLCNAFAMEALPLALDKLVAPWLAIICSVTGVLFFGEIIPQALCTGPSQIKIAECMCPIVLCLMYCTIPISWPISKLLDKLMGEHELQRYNNDELKHLILLHTKKALEELDSDDVPDDVEGLDDYNANLISGALEFNKKNVKEVMTDFKQVECLRLTDVIDNELLKQIAQIGYSRIPISQTKDERTVIGVFLTKSLVGYSACDETILQALQRGKIDVRPPIYFTPVTSLASVAKTFKDGSSHMGIVCDERQTAIYLRDQSDKIILSIKKGEYEQDYLDDHVLLGILTLENVIEFILKMDIKDEKDQQREKLQQSRGKNDQNSKVQKQNSKTQDIFKLSSDSTFEENFKGQRLLRRGVSVKYDLEEDNEEKERSQSSNQVFKSKFAQQFTQAIAKQLKTSSDVMKLSQSEVANQNLLQFGNQKPLTSTEAGDSTALLISPGRINESSPLKRSNTSEK